MGFFFLDYWGSIVLEEKLLTHRLADSHTLGKKPSVMVVIMYTEHAWRLEMEGEMCALEVCGLVMEIRADLDHGLHSGRGWSQVLCIESSQLMDNWRVSAVISMATQEKKNTTFFLSLKRLHVGCQGTRRAGFSSCCPKIVSGSCVRSKREGKAALQDKVIAEGFVVPKLFKEKSSSDKIFIPMLLES